MAEKEKKPAADITLAQIRDAQDRVIVAAGVLQAAIGEKKDAQKVYDERVAELIRVSVPDGAMPLLEGDDTAE